MKKPTLVSGVNPHAVNETPPPDQYTEEQFFAAGRFLARIEHGMQWAIGDWYNAIPAHYPTKEAACKEVELDYSHACKCGSVAKVYPILLRSKKLGFKHHQVLAIEELSEDQRASLFRRAEWGELQKDGTRRPWTTTELVQERDKVLGRERVPLPDFDAKGARGALPVDHSCGRRFAEIPR